MGIKITPAYKVREQEETIAKAKEACRDIPRNTDTTDYKQAQLDFRNEALYIRQYIKDNYPAWINRCPSLEYFRGSFDEVRQVMNLMLEQDDALLTKHLLMLSQYDNTMEYEARALCIEQPEPWYTCWEDELGPWTR